MLRRIDGVREVSADHSTGRVQVRVGPELGDRAERIDAAGFQVLDTDDAGANSAQRGSR